MCVDVAIVTSWKITNASLLNRAYALAVAIGSSFRSLRDQFRDEVNRVEIASAGNGPCGPHDATWLASRSESRSATLDISGPVDLSIRRSVGPPDRNDTRGEPGKGFAARPA